MQELHTLSLNKNKLLDIDNVVRNAAEKFPKLAFLCGNFDIVLGPFSRAILTVLRFVNNPIPPPIRPCSGTTQLGPCSS